MRQVEIDEISDAFKEAWTDYFGDIIHYVMFDARTQKDSLYNESKHKVYDFTNKKSFHGSLRESPSLDELKQGGGKTNKEFEVTIVTKELIDSGIQYVSTNDIIQYIDRFGNGILFKITDEFQKVQLVDNKVFTKLKVIPTGYFEMNLYDDELVKPLMTSISDVLLDPSEETVSIPEDTIEDVFNIYYQTEYDSSLLTDSDEWSNLSNLEEDISGLITQDLYNIDSIVDFESLNDILEILSSTQGTRSSSESLLNDSSILLSSTMILTDGQLPLTFEY